MGPTTFTSIVMVAFALVVLTMASYAWFGDWQPAPRRAHKDQVTAEVEALRRAIEAYEQDQRTG